MLDTALVWRFAFVQVLAVTFGLAPVLAGTAPPPSAVTFDGLGWGTARRNVRSDLASHGYALFASTPDDFYRGAVDGAAATVECVFTPDDQLVFVRVIFDGPAGDVTSALTAEYGKAESCNNQKGPCRWQRGGTAVTYATSGDPYAAPGQPSLEYSAGSGLEARYDEEVNDTENDNDRGMDR
jgi:hypothetical protein